MPAIWLQQVGNEWLILYSVVVANFGVGVLILVFRKRIRLFIKSLVPRMSEDAEFWTSRVILVGSFFLLVIPTILVAATLIATLST